jgi:hypothetical protein
MFGRHKSDISILYEELKDELADLHNKEVSFFYRPFFGNPPRFLAVRTTSKKEDGRKKLKGKKTYLSQQLRL